MDENQIYYLGRVEKNTIVLKQNSKASKTAFNGNISRITFRSGSVGINNAYLDFWTDDGNRTTIGFYTDGVSGIQMLKNDTVVWNLKP